MNTESMEELRQSDAELVAASLAGSPDAFGQIVARYQTLVCSLAYCATGSVSQSEDLAQETFVAAWKDLAQLREPAKLRSWLCTIVRFRINREFRRQGREPIHAAEPLESAVALPALQALPSAQAITNEETTLLWRALERIPEAYREPLVLFYRQHQSVEAVAGDLDLTEEAVKQRLSRGRKLLQEEVLAFVEGALGRTNPGQAFTLAVLAVIPASLATSAKATIAAAAVKGGAAAKGAAAGSLLGLWFGPALGVLGGYFGLRASLKNAHTPRERASVLGFAAKIAGAVVVFTGSIVFIGLLAGSPWKSHSWLLLGLGLAITLAYGVAVFVCSWRFGHAFAKLRGEEQQLHPELFRTQPLPLVWDYRSRATLFGLPLVHCRSGRRPGEKLRPAVGWISFGEVAYGILFANGAVAVGGISMGGASVGIISFGGLGLGLLAFGGVALGGVALGGAAIGLIASGGLALAWHAALGGLAAAHELALGGSASASHANDAVARDFFLRYRWLDFTQGAPWNVFFIFCFVPVFLQMLAWKWWQRKIQKIAKQT